MSNELDKYIKLLQKNKENIEMLGGYYVYALWRDDEIVYVGQTIHLKHRINTHTKTKDFNMYSYFECENETQMKSIETSLIVHLKPEYNKLLGDEYESLNKLRKRIRAISEEHKYSPKYYVNQLRSKLEETDIEVIDFKGTTAIPSKSVPKALGYILEED